MSRVTLKMIAQEAGVAVSTVSMALRNTGTLSKQKVAAIQKIAQDMGYRPNPVLAALASKRFRDSANLQSTPVALLEFPIDGQSEKTAIFYRDHISKHADELGYGVTTITEKELARYANPAKTLYNRGVAGVIITGQPNEGLKLDDPLWSSMALVQCGRFRSQLPMDCVRPDIFQSIKLLVDQLVSRGYERIGFAFGRHGIVLEDDEARYGAARALQHFHLKPTQCLPVFDGEFTDMDAKLAWIDHHQPDAIIGFTPADWYALKNAGYRMPEDLGFVSLLHAEDDQSPGEIAGLIQQHNVIARQSVILMDQLIRHKQSSTPEGPVNVLVPSLWHEGRSIRPR